MNSLRPFTLLTGALAALALLALPVSARAQAADEDEDTPPSATPPAATPAPAAPAPASPPPATSHGPVRPATPDSTAPGTSAPSPAAVAPAPAPVAPAPVAPAQPSVPPAAPDLAPGGEVQNYKLIGGAPLGDPDVRVHIVEKKPLSDFGRHEVVLFPIVPQINGKYTNHLGVAAEYLYHFQENVAFQVTPMYYYVSNESQFNQDLINIAQLQAQAATQLTMIWGAEAGIEATPIYGKFAFYEGYIAHFALVLNAGIGFAQTHVQLQSSSPANPNAGTPAEPAEFGDTGYKFLGNVGGGFRVKFGDHWAVRLEIRDLVYSASVDSINGCSLADLSQLEAQQPPLNASCHASSFPTFGNPPPAPDVLIAKGLLAQPSSDVLNQVEFFGGLAYVF